MSTFLFAAFVFVSGAIVGASLVETDASERYRELQMDYNQKMMLRDTRRGSMYVRH